MTLLQSLKEQTRPNHDKLEGGLDLLDESMTKSGYTKVLEKFYGFYVPFENEIKKLGLELNLSERSKVKLLENDLKALGLDPRKLPLAKNLPPLTSSEEAYGAMYVLEGSTLGGMVLTKHFGKKFNLDHLNGLSFFNSYGDQTMPMWREFSRFLEQKASENQWNHSEIISNAKKTFDSLQQWLNSAD